MATTSNPKTQLSEVPLTAEARAQLSRARTVIALWVGLVFLVFSAVVVISVTGQKHVHWVNAIAPIVIIVGLLAFGIFRVSQLTHDLNATSMTRFTGDWRERLSTPLRNSTFIRVKLPGSFMLLRTSHRITVAAAQEADVETHWQTTRGHLDYATRSRLLVAIDRDPV